MINNRQAGRRRGRGGGGGGNGQRQGGGMQGNGSRIDNRARGNASQLFEKYKNMAADAQRAGDRVNTEYYLQFADHYFRVLSEQRGRFEDQQQPRVRRDEFDYEGDDEFGDEGEPIRAGEQGEASRQDRDVRGNRENGRETGRDTGRDGNRDTGRDAGRDTGRDGVRDGGEARADGGRREWRDRPERGNGGARNDVRAGQPEQVGGQHRADPVLPGESLEQRAEEVMDADRPLDPPARRRGRPRRESVDGAADAAVADAPAGGGFEADRLPPALTVAANDQGDAPPRRRRARRPADEAPTAAE